MGEKKSITYMLAPWIPWSPRLLKASESCWVISNKIKEGIHNIFQEALAKQIQM